MIDKLRSPRNYFFTPAHRTFKISSSVDYQFKFQGSPLSDK